MKKQILFIHSAGAQGPHDGSGDLVTFLQNALGPEYEVLYPKMPNPEDPKYEPWKIQVGKELAALAGDVILVGHSLGGSVLLKYLSEEKFENSMTGLFLVAPAYWGGDDDWLNEEYILREDFASRPPKGLPIFFYHSRNDDVVPFAHLALYAKKLPQATIRQLDGEEHIFSNGLPGFVEDIKSL
jgi:uncharacterized protein